MLEKTFTEIGLSEIAHDIYLRLLERGASSARELAEHLGIPRPSVYDHIKSLVTSGLVSEDDRENKKMFSVLDIKNLPRLVESKIENLEYEKKALEATLSSIGIPKSIEPKIQFYAGMEGVKRVLSDFLWYENSEVLAMWSSSKVLALVGVEFMESLNRKRIKRNIRLRGIWPRNRKVDFKHYPFMAPGKEFKRELRLAPKMMTWDMSYRLYEDKAAFISSEKETFAFLVHSRDFAQLLRSQFEVIWRLSEPIKHRLKPATSL